MQVGFWRCRWNRKKVCRIIWTDHDYYLPLASMKGKCSKMRACSIRIFLMNVLRFNLRSSLVWSLRKRELSFEPTVSLPFGFLSFTHVQFNLSGLYYSPSVFGELSNCVRHLLKHSWFMKEFFDIRAHKICNSFKAPTLKSVTSFCSTRSDRFRKDGGYVNLCTSGFVV